MKRLIALALVATTLATTGCANLTPEQNAALGAGLVGAAAVAGAVYDARHPVYVAPVYAPVYVAPVYVHGPNCWQSAVTRTWSC